MTIRRTQAARAAIALEVRDAYEAGRSKGLSLPLFASSPWPNFPTGDPLWELLEAQYLLGFKSGRDRRRAELKLVADDELTADTEDAS